MKRYEDYNSRILREQADRDKRREERQRVENDKTERKEKSRRNKSSYKRGYRRRWNDDLGKWEYRGGNGFGQFFLSSFSLFMGILILFNVTFGFGFNGYKTAVQYVYTITETVGGTVNRIITYIMAATETGEYTLNDGSVVQLNLNQYFEAEHRDNGKKILFGLYVVGDREEAVVVYSEVPEVPSGIRAKRGEATIWWNWFGVRVADGAPQDINIGGFEGYNVNRKEGNILEIRDAYLSGVR